MMETSSRLHSQTQLRRADWRFLLPLPESGVFEHLVLLGATPELAQRLQSSGAASRVSCNLPATRCADAVALLHGSAISPQEASSCLKPDGAFYLEVQRGAFRTQSPSPRRYIGKLRALGLQTNGVYAVIPSFDSSQIYMPLDTPGILHWYVRTLYPTFTFRQRLIELGVRFVSSLNSQAYSHLTRAYAVTAVYRPTRPAAPSLLQHPDLPAALRQPAQRVLLLTDAGNRVTLLPFAPRGKAPSAIIKIPKLPDFNDRTVNEQAALIKIRSQLDERMAASLPQPLGLLSQGDIRAAIETYMPGQSMLRTSSRWGGALKEKAGDLRSAAGWIAAFHRQTQSCRINLADSSAASEWIETPFAAFHARFGLTPGERSLFDSCRRHIQSLSSTTLPLVALHRDYNVWNIFRHGNALNVIDWEGSRRGLPLCDLLHFVTHWHETARRLWSLEEQLRGFQQLFLDPSPEDFLVRAVHDAIAQYMEELNIDDPALPVLLVYTWVELALRRYEQQRDGANLSPDPRAGNRNFAFISLLAEHATYVFGGQT